MIAILHTVEPGVTLKSRNALRMEGRVATFRKIKTGWRAEVFKNKIRRSKVLPTKREAQDWAAREEYKIANGDKIAAATLLADVFDRYAREISPANRGHRWEEMRLAKFGRDLGEHKISEIEPKHIAAWRDQRLREVSTGTVRREMVLMASVFRVARDEWGMIKTTPMEGVRKPPPAAPRERLPKQYEIDRLRHVAGTDLANSTARAFHCFMFACETAMRAGEICGLTWDKVDLERRVAHLPKTKNGSSRDVPLTSEAVDMLRQLPDLDPVFGLTPQNLDALFRKIKKKAGVEGLHFHDSRHYATVQLAKRVEVLDLARILGHRDLRMLLVYYNEDMSDIAKKLG